MIAPEIAKMSARPSVQPSAMPVPFEQTGPRRARGQGAPAGQRGGR